MYKEYEPEIIGSTFLIECTRKCGMISVAGMGVVGLSWAEIKAWSELSGTALEYWEFEVIKELSDAFAAMLREAKDWECKPVFDPTTLKHFDRRRHAKMMREASRTST